MARNDGIDRTSVRNANLNRTQIGNTQRHNEREKDAYTNPDIVPERTALNIHFKKPSGGYAEMFTQMEADKVISTRGLKADACLYGELIFDVNSAYFDNHGSYDFAKQFYTDAYRSAIEIVGGEQFILSAVMHADERNRAMSEALGRDVYHYHLHVVYIPVVEKQILWSKRCKDKSLVGTVKETITQVSSSKKWKSLPAVDEQGRPILQKNGKPVLRKSYSVLQDDFFNAMRAAGYTDVERLMVDEEMMDEEDEIAPYFPMISLDAMAREREAAARKKPDRESALEKTEEGSFICFTSGTSKSSRGVVLTSKSLCSVIENFENLMEEGERVYLPLPYHHIYAFVHIYRILHYGKTLCLGRMGRNLMEDFQIMKPDILMCVPSILKYLIEQDYFPDYLKLIFTAGSYLRPELAEQAAGRQVKLYNLYGLSETMGSIAHSTPEKGSQ